MVYHRWIQHESADACAANLSHLHFVAPGALERTCSKRGCTRRCDQAHLWADAAARVRLDLVLLRKTTVLYWNGTVVDSRLIPVCSICERCLLTLYSSSDA
ncbi:hypothetical protein MRX96_016927 [Rhipicephalus microplus]